MGYAFAVSGPNRRGAVPTAIPTDNASGWTHYNAAPDAGLVDLKRVPEFTRRDRHSFYRAVDR